MKNQQEKCTASEFRSLLSGYEIYSCPRTSRKGGGMAAIVRDNLNVDIGEKNIAKTSESMDLSIRSRDSVIHVIIVYRPPPSKVNGYTVKKFVDKFSSLLESSIVFPGKLVILCDFNFHVEGTNDVNTFSLPPTRRDIR